MADNEIQFGLDLDAKEFIAKGGEALEVISKMAGQGVALAGTLTNVAAAGALVGAAILALKGAASFVEMGDSVAQVNAQFEILGQQAGIATETLKEGLEKASGGLIDDTELLKIANKAIVEMGDSAKRLPEILELSRKAAALTGQTAEQAFQGMTDAMARGNVRMLKQYGIIVDQKKAWEDYAKANNLAVGALSEAERRQAVMNAALKQGQESLKGINPDMAQTANLLQQIKVISAEVGEAISIAFDKVAGPTIRNYLSGVKEMADDVKAYVTRSYGSGKEQANAEIADLEKRLQQAKGKIVDAQFGQRGWLDQVLHGSDQTVVGTAKMEIASIEQQLAAAKQKLGAGSPGAPTSGEGAAVATDRADYQKREELANKFQMDLLKLRQSYNQSEIKNAQTEYQLQESSTQRKLMLEEEFELQKKQLRNNQNLTTSQRDQLEIQMEQNHNQRMIALDEQLESERMQMLDNYLAHSQNVAQGISRAFEVNSKKATKDLQDFGKIGTMSVDSFEKHAADMFTAFGKGSESAGDAARGAIFGFLGDMAGALGKLELAKGLDPTLPGFPADLVAGAALLALGGVFQALGGDTSGGGGGGGGGGGSSQGGEAGPTGFGTRTDESPSVSSYAQPQKSLTLQVQGNYFDTDDTRTKLVDILRSASDVSDYRVLQIGQGS